MDAATAANKRMTRTMDRQSQPPPPLAASEYPTSLSLEDASTSVVVVSPDSSSTSASMGNAVTSGQPTTSSTSSSSITSIQSALRHNSLHRHTLSTRTIAHYIRMEQIGEGTYGQVYRAMQCLPPAATATTTTTTAATPSTMQSPPLPPPAQPKIVALKKIRLHHPSHMGIPPTVLREIKILKALQHKNLVKMYEVISSKGVETYDWEDEREDEKRKLQKMEEIEMMMMMGDGGAGEMGEGGMGLGEEGGGSMPPPPSKYDDDMDDTEKHSTKRKDKKISGSTSSIVAHKPTSTNKKPKRDPLTAFEQLRESYKGNLFLVLEYISHDLTGLLDMAVKFTEVQIKSITRQLLEVLEFMHCRNYVHRDLKTSNVLITDRFEVKLADFGLARSLDSVSFLGRMGGGGGNNDYNTNEGEYTNKVITLWYRPPELLLGETKYGCSVDIWSAGCIFAEIILGRPIFTGKTDMDQLKQIFDLVGTPNSRSWEGYTELKLIRTGEVCIDKEKPSRLRDKYGGPNGKIQPVTAVSLLEKLLELDPKKRVSASRALHHRYFQTEPLAPKDPSELGTISLGSGGGSGGDGSSGYHEFQTKKRRREAKVVARAAGEESKSRGESVEKQKEAFDRAYRDHLKKGGQ